MSKIKIEDIRAEVEKDGWKLISSEYTNLDTEMEFLCDEGHGVFAPWKKIRQGRECPVCKLNNYKNQDHKIIPKDKGVFRILALDQATRTSGFSIFDGHSLVKYGTFIVDLDDEIARDMKIKHWLLSMIDSWQIDFVAIEGIQYQPEKGVTTFETLARLQGILMECLYERNIPYKIAPTNTWRHHCGVKGRARADQKKSMQLLVKQWFDVNVDNDCADAIGIGKYTSDTYVPATKVFNWE